MFWAPAYEQVADRLLPEHFHRTKHQDIWTAMVSLKRQGIQLDPLAIRQRIEQLGILDTYTDRWADVDHDLVGLLDDTSRGANASTHADAIIAAWQNRQLLAYAANVAELAYDPTRQPDEKITDAVLAAHDIQRGFQAGSRRVNARLVSDLVQEPWHRPDWVIPGMLALSDRMVLTAASGLGKSTWMRQAGLFIAAGFHPFLGSTTKLWPLDPQPVLSVDLENGEEGWREECRPVVEFLKVMCDRHGMQSDAFPMALHAPTVRYDPVNSRADRAHFLAYVAEVRPRLITFGPIYKMEQRGTDDAWHKGAGRIQDLVDEIRFLHAGCAVVLETHMGASKEANAPRGAADWQYWPDLGIQLARTKDDPMTTSVIHYRPPRFARRYRYWPKKFARQNDAMPLKASQWTDGTFPNDGDRTPAWDRPPDWIVQERMAAADGF